MATLFSLGKVLKGAASQYKITKGLRNTVWLAKYSRDQLQELVIIKSVQSHFRVANERGVLKRFQEKTPYLRPLVDEITDQALPTTIVLRHLESHLLRTSIERTLNRKELKYVSRRVLEALNVMHREGYVHADVKPDNVLTNYGSQDPENRFTDVQLADLGSSYPQTHKYAREGLRLGQPSGEA